MSVSSIEQDRQIGMFKVIVAIDEPLEYGDLDVLDALLTRILDKIQSVLLIESKEIEQ